MAKKPAAKKTTKKTPLHPPVKGHCAICDNKPADRTVNTKAHGELAVCAGCAQWASERGYLK